MKPNKGGWIRHRGGKCPDGARGQVIDYRMRDGDVSTSMRFGDVLRWDHRNTPGDIMAYRTHFAEHIAPMTEEGIKDADEGKLTPLNEVKAKWHERFVGPQPIQWRDRIRSIDAQKLDAEAKHIAAMLELGNERQGLVERLAAEGFVLISECSQAGAVDGVQADDDAECSDISADMSDWRNWLEGDMVRLITACEYSDMEPGKEGTITEIEPRDPEGMYFQVDNYFWPSTQKLQWVSRP